MSDPFTSMQKAADYFNVNYKSILKYSPHFVGGEDTKLATLKDEKPLAVLLFSHELTQPEKNHY